MAEYIIASNGIFQKYEDDLFRGVVKVEGPFFKHVTQVAEGVYHCMGPVASDPSKPKVEEEISLKFKPIPISLFKTALNFLRWCYDEHKSEGFLAFTYRNEKWGLVCPEQWDSAGGVCYHPENHPAEACGIVGDIHSHPKFGSSEHSGIDHKDEVKNNGLFIVVRDFSIMTCDPKIFGTIRGQKWTINPDFVFDFNDAADKDDKQPKGGFPEEWKSRFHSGECDACKKSRTVYSTAGASRTYDLRSRDTAGKFRRPGMPPHGHLYEDDYIDQVESMNLGDPDEDGLNELLSDPAKVVLDAYKIWSDEKEKPALFHCDNEGCKKPITALHCSECKKPVHEVTVIQSVADMMEQVLVGEIDGDGVEDREDDKKGGGKEDDKDEDLTVLSLEKTCDATCPLRGSKHKHVEAKDLKL